MHKEIQGLGATQVNIINKVDKSSEVRFDDGPWMLLWNEHILCWLQINMNDIELHECVLISWNVAITV